MKYDKLYIYAVFDLPRPLSCSPSRWFFLPVSKASADCDDCDGKQKTPVAASSAVDNCVDYTLMPQDTWFHKLIVKKVNSPSCFVDVVIRNTLPYSLFFIKLTFKKFCVIILCLCSFFRKGAGHDSVAMQAAIVTGLFSPSPLIWLVQLLLWPHLLGPRLAEASPACPAPCSCSNQASRVICTRKGLNEVPQSISSNTRYLNLQENSIQVTSLTP